MIPTTSYSSLTWLASVKTKTPAFGRWGEYEAVPMRSTELLAQAAKNKLAKTSSPTGITFISIVNQHDEEPRAAQSTRENPERLQPLRHARHNNRPVRQQNYEEHLAQWSFDRIGERNEPKQDRHGAKLLS